jgi:hypothetical protein
MLVADKNSMLGGKLMALIGRKTLAARDIFDVHFFLKQNWEVERDVLLAYEAGSLVECVKKGIALVESVPDNKILVGLGELIDDKQKVWVRAELKKDVLFLFRLIVENEGGKSKI